MPIVETHAHLYSEDEERYPPRAKPSRTPDGTGTIEHLQAATSEIGVSHVVAVQTRSFYEWDNRLTADAIRDNPGWMTGVCNLRSDDPQSPGELARLVDAHGFRGFRLELPPGGGSYYHPGSVAICQCAQELGVVICSHANGVAHLPDLGRLLAEFPEVAFCTDHCCYPKVDDPIILDSVLEMARFPNLHAKISFYLQRSPDLVQMGRRVVQTFGPDRCMWGGDFPAEKWHPDLTYGEHLAIMAEEICQSPAEREAILGSTPMRIWFG